MYMLNCIFKTLFMLKSMINAVSNIFILKIHVILIRYEPQHEYTGLRAFR